VLDGEEVKYAIKVPYALSILAHNNPTAEVIGLDQFAEEDRPPLYIHYLFNIMVFIGMFMVLVSLLYVVGKARSWQFIHTRWFRWIIVAGGPLSIIAIEAGWWLAEVGRQPWILYGLMRTPEGATTSDHVDLMMLLFTGVYAVLAIGSIVVLVRMFKKNPIEREIEDRHSEKGGDFL